MDNQHKHIKGYRDLSAGEIALMNEGKELAEKVGQWLVRLDVLPSEKTEKFPDGGIDHRWLSIGKTHLQQGFMAVIRSIAKPTTF